MKCPVCDKQSKPHCPHYARCKYRKADLCSESICWRAPERCLIYNRNKKDQVDFCQEKFNPSER